MSRESRITLQWADGDYDFRLSLAQLEELDEKLAVGPLALYRRLVDGTWRVLDVREVIRIGLIGGGQKPQDATRLVRRYVDAEADWIEHARIAAAIVGAIFVGWEHEPLGKPSGAKTSKETTVSSSAPSMPMQQ